MLFRNISTDTAGATSMVRGPRACNAADAGVRVIGCPRPSCGGYRRRPVAAALLGYIATHHPDPLGISKRAEIRAGLGQVPAPTNTSAEAKRWTATQPSPTPSPNSQTSNPEPARRPQDRQPSNPRHSRHSRTRHSVTKAACVTLPPNAGFRSRRYALCGGASQVAQSGR